jgi:hypothetical protein
LQRLDARRDEPSVNMRHADPANDLNAAKKEERAQENGGGGL